MFLFALRPSFAQRLAARSFSAHAKHNVEAARVIPTAAPKVWAEMRDFVLHMKHFSLLERTTHANPEEAASDAKGCKRTILPPDGGEALIVETCTEHSDKKMALSLEAEEPNAVGITDYLGKIEVRPLSDGTALAQYSGCFNGPDLLRDHITASYNTFFASIASDLEDVANVVVERSGPAASVVGRVVGKIAVVTGGASGLGEAVCRTLAAEGATVVVVDRDGEAGRRIAADIPGGHFAEVNVSKSKEVAMLFEKVSSALGGRVDIVVNNAGIAGEQVPTHEHPLENWHAVTNVNFHGAFYVLRSALAQLTAQSPRGGVVVNMSSIAGLCGMDKIPAYTASKAALVGLTRSTAVEYASRGIRVVAVAPTATKTSMVEGFMAASPPEVAQALESFNPKPGMPVPNDVAMAVLFLSSDEASWVSGSVLEVDGAYCAGSAIPHGRG